MSRSPSSVRGRCSPGVSTSTSWASGRVRMPRTACRVVCGRLEVIAIFSPTRALVSVDLPALGRPTRLAKPEREVVTQPSCQADGLSLLECLLRPRSAEVPGLHPLAEAPRRQPPARQQHAVGLLDALARVRAHGHLADGRPRAAEVVAAHERLLVPHVLVDQRGRREVLGEVPLQDRPGRRAPQPGRGRPARRRGLRAPQARPVDRDRVRRPPVLDAVRTGHAVRGGGGLPVQPVRPDEGLAARRLPADQGRALGLRPQPGELLRPDRAGGVRAGQPGAGDRARRRTRCCWAGCSPTRTPTGTGSAPTTCSCRSTGRKAPVHSYNRDGAMRYDNPGDPVYAPNSYGGPKADPSFGELELVGRGRRDRAQRVHEHREDDDFVPGRTRW